MEITVDALLLKAAELGENDKIVTLFTADRGKLSASMKGVKKASAKLKFAAQPFCFAEYVLAERAGRYTVISASLYNDFYAIREDVCAFYAASVVCEACDKLLYEGMVNPQLLVCAVNALKRLAAGESSSALVAFLAEALSLAGYPVTAERCPACGKEIGKGPYFDFASGSFFCHDCAVGTLASESTYHTLRAAIGTEQDVGSSDGEKRALRLLKAYYSYQTDKDLLSLGEYLKLL